MYSVVEFTDLQEVEVVPSDWITDGFCWYPNCKSTDSIRKAIKKRETPTQQNYTLYKARVFRSYDTYAAARIKLKTAEYESDISSEVEITPKSKRTPRKRRLECLLKKEPESELEMSHTSASRALPIGKNILPSPPPFPPPPPLFQSPVVSSFDNNYTDQHRTLNLPYSSVGMGHDSNPPSFSQLASEVFGEPVRTTPYFTNTATGSCSANGMLHPGFDSTRNPMNNISTLEFPRPRLVLNNPDGMSVAAAAHPPVPNPDHGVFDRTDKRLRVETGCYSPQNSNQLDFENWMVRNVNIIKAQMKQLQESVDVLLQKNAVDGLNSNQVVTDVAHFAIPVASSEMLENLYGSLSSDNARNSLIIKLGMRGGKDVRECTRRVMSTLLTDRVAERFSWLGSRGDKNAFSKSVLKDLVIDAVRANGKTNLASADDVENAVKEWLKNSKKRLIAEGKKTGPTHQRNMEPEIPQDSLVSDASSEASQD
ncbi:unnamed protein product [Orchesella dallaii]|uniref:DUF4806 domain-containing protein n=1 Tax=Orchesella dallaii TaxID=48710 RepID=A0ABP1R6I9_9HEXA